MSKIILMIPYFREFNQYFSLFLLILLPEGAETFTPGKSRSLYVVICTTLMLALLIRNQPYYVFFWQ